MVVATISTIVRVIFELRKTAYLYLLNLDNGD